MYAIIRTGGKQYRVAKGDVLKIEKLPEQKKNKVVFSDVLMIADGDNVLVGAPIVKDAVVEGKILSNGKSEKVVVYKYKSKKDYRKKQGHRQPYTEIEISKVALAKAKKEADKAEGEEVVKEAKKAPAKKAAAKKDDGVAKVAKTAAKKAPAKKAAKKDEE